MFFARRDSLRIFGNEEMMMDVNRIVAELDAEISRLQKIREALGSIGEAKASTQGKRGRPKGSKNAQKSAPVAAKAAKVVTPVAAPTAKKSAKRKLSPEGRKRIAEAMKRRWAAHRKAGS
jgi:hypothetical protein